MLRRLFTLLSAACLLLSAAACVLGWRSEHPAPGGGGDRVSWLGRDGRRHTVRSEGGEVTWLAAPAANLAARPTHRVRTAADVTAAEHAFHATASWPVAWASTRPPATAADPGLGQAVGRIRNADVAFSAAYALGADGRVRVDYTTGPTVRFGSASEWLAAYVMDVPYDTGGYNTGTDPVPYPQADVRAALLAALEDPNRFAAAHVLLCELDGRYGDGVARHPDGSLTGARDGLTYRLSPPPAEKLPKRRCDLPSA
ncbi:MAG TPA: hypothetical protein VF796_09875, partial [Humisphaera sp.]